MKKIVLLFTFLISSFSLLAQSVSVTANLSGRYVKSGNLSIPEYDFSEIGAVVVNIEVNGEGKVVSAFAGADGTTIRNASLWRKCRLAALEAIFQERIGSEETQSGTITFLFYTNNNDLALDAPIRVPSNPLAGSDLPETFSLIENPIDYQGAKKFKVLQVIAKDGALAQSENTEYKTIEVYGDPIVLLISDQPNVYHDDLIIRVGLRQKTLQLGTYRYETRMGLSKTVPIVMIVDK